MDASLESQRPSEAKPDLELEVLPAKGPAQRPKAAEACWLCGEPTVEIHCKIVCLRCGFRRDCSDP
jgi:hypothetical protein